MLLDALTLNSGHTWLSYKCFARIRLQTRSQIHRSEDSLSILVKVGLILSQEEDYFPTQPKWEPLRMMASSVARQTRQD